MFNGVGAHPAEALLDEDELRVLQQIGVGGGKPTQERENERGRGRERERERGNLFSTHLPQHPNTFYASIPSIIPAIYDIMQ